MQVKVGPLKYEWLEDWGKTPDIPPSRQNGRTHGVAVARNGKTYVFHQSKPALLVFNDKGELVDSVSHDFPAAHGLTLVSEGRDDFLWLTDQDSGLVGKVTLNGKIVQEIEKPDHPVYKTGKYSPTWVAVHPKTGDIFVTDGYGSGYIHRYTKNGLYLSSFNGSESAAGAFNCPHAVYFDVRGGKEPELYVTDRANKRIQVFDGEGKFKRVFGSDFLVHPCAFAAFKEFLFVPELFGRMAILDGKDRFIGYVGDNTEISTAPGWPGNTVKGWPDVPKDQIHEGKFNSPHGVGTGPDGSVYIVEWIVAGRITRLRPA